MPAPIIPTSTGVTVKKDKGFSKNVFLLGLVSFLNDWSSETIMPILPFFIKSLGGTGMVIGLVGGIRDSLSSILKVLFGYLSDKTGKRKIFVSSGYLTSAFFKLLLAFSRTWESVLAFASLERVGKGLRTAPRDAIISESMPKKRGEGFGIHRALDTSGAVMGSLTALALFWFFSSEITSQAELFKLIIFIAAVLSFFSLAPLIFVKEKKSEPLKTDFVVSIKGLTPSLKRFLVVSGLFSLGNFTYMFFVLRVQDFFPKEMSIIIPIMLYALFNIFYAAFSIPAGVLSDKFGRKRVLVLGYLFFAVTSFGFIFSNSLVWFIALFALYGIVNATIDGNQRAFVSDLSSKELRATALGTFHTVTGIMALPASIIAGILWQFSPVYTFAYGGVLAFVSVLLFVAFSRKFSVFSP
ncbi:MAG: MFS transporter [Candidatus Diapherotrites archaeon]|nr:MFS transporter [Candidatus Diapherotrites archaeon]